MAEKSIPSNDRVQILTEEMLTNDAFTVRNPENGVDQRIYSSQDDEGPGIPFRADDEIPIEEEFGFWGVEDADGLWFETEGSTAGTVQVLKGVALERNVRRDMNVTASVSPDTYDTGATFDTSTYPINLNPSSTIEVLYASILGAEIELDITTTKGTNFVLPVDDAFTLDSYLIDAVDIKDPNNNTPRIAGGWAGE